MNKRAVLLGIGGIILLNILSFFVFGRLDLTEDKRYSISDATVNLLENLENSVEITVYLSGDNLPGGFERLRRAVKETLSEFKTYANRNISYEFVNPDALADAEKEKLYEEFQNMGITPTTIFDQSGGQKTEMLIFPYALVKSGEKQEVVLLLKAGQAGVGDSESKLNSSFENVEYELASAIQKLSGTNKKNVGLLTEFTNQQPVAFMGMVNTLKEWYNLYIIDAKSSPTFDGLDALIMVSPDKKVDDSTKLKIDQFIMKGGRVLFFVDGLKVDSIGVQGTYAQPLDVNLDDMLFNYGIRINKNIVKDGLNAATIPLVVGETGNEPNIQPVQYRYFPTINNFGESLITKNIDMVYAKYAATIDTVNQGDGLKKTPLLLTSPYTKILNAPALITFNEARTDTKESEYNQGVKAIAYLVEGKFKSMFHSNFSGKELLKESEPTKILVVSDANVIQNDVNQKNGTYYPLGLDKYFKTWYGNEDFLVNALNYMVDANGILVSKEKNVTLRPLDLLKVRNHRLQIQVINILLPLLVLVLFGVGRYFYLRKMYN